MSDVKCPYCESVFEPEDLCGLDLHTTNDFKCSECEKEFYIDVNISYSILKNCELNDIEHEWEDEGFPIEDGVIYDCNNCDEWSFVKQKETPCQS